MTRTSPSTETAAAATPDLLQFVTPEQVCDAIKAAGCAVTPVEQEGVMRLHSACHGVGFQVLWGNVAVGGQYLDFTLSCPLRMQGGSLPESALSSWHRAKRFARVAQHGDFVVLEMDVVVAGGVSANHLALTMRLWTQVMGEYFTHLRNFRAESTPAGGESQAAAPTAHTAPAVLASTRDDALV